ncbi:hypothetical protein H671_1g4081 [Cricetulus griseus]|nr:hypothetical protein H671_1g4081 [Cricetulus griseus]
MGGGVAKNGPWPDLSLQPAPGPLEFQGRCRWPCSLEANSYTHTRGPSSTRSFAQRYWLRRKFACVVSANLEEEKELLPASGLPRKPSVSFAYLHYKKNAVVQIYAKLMVACY